MYGKIVYIVPTPCLITGFVYVNCIRRMRPVVDSLSPPSRGLSRSFLLDARAISLQLPSSILALLFALRPPGQPPHAAHPQSLAPTSPLSAADNFDNCGALPVPVRLQPTLEVTQYSDGRREVTIHIGQRRVICDFNSNKDVARSSCLMELYEQQQTLCAQRGSDKPNCPALRPMSGSRSAFSDEPPSKRQKLPDDVPSSSPTVAPSLLRVSSNVQAKLRARPILGDARRASRGSCPNPPHVLEHRHLMTASQLRFPPLCDRPLLLRARQVSHLIHALQMTHTQQQSSAFGSSSSSHTNAVNWVHASATDLLKRLKHVLDANTALFRSLAARIRNAADRPTQLAEVVNHTEALRVERAHDLITLTTAYEGILNAI